jgi:hypothetical protein
VDVAVTVKVFERAGVAVELNVAVSKGPVAVGETAIFREQPPVAIKTTVGITKANRAQRRKDFMLPPEKRYRGIEAGNKKGPTTPRKQRYVS